MTIEEVQTSDARPPLLTGPGTWSLTWPGVRTVALLELRQRIRSTRWVALLVVWVLLIGGLSALTRFATHAIQSNQNDAGATMFGVIIFLVISLGVLVAPALSATSINGDRVAGVLATMQSTLLSPAEIAVGKLLAAWTAALALLGGALPFVLWAYLEGGTPFSRLLVTVVLTALTLLVVCAVGLGWSAVAARTSSSSVLTYLTVSLLTLGLPVIFGLSLALSQTDEVVTVREPVFSETDGTELRCETRRITMTRTHSEDTWWLLAPSPYVVVADASPPRGNSEDPLSVIREAVREARLGSPDTEDWCDGPSPDQTAARVAERDQLPPAWPWGLAVDVAVLAGFLAVAVRRLRTPSDRLPRGSRVA